MLADARVFGHVFDPLTVFWCFGTDRGLRCVVAEVHNTFGQRHAYLLMPGPDGNVRVDKQFYVSPFNDVKGDYTMHFTLTNHHVGVTIALRRNGHTMFDAELHRNAYTGNHGDDRRLALRRPLMTLRVSALIRLHGVRLWLRGLRSSNARVHVGQEGV